MKIAEMPGVSAPEPTYRQVIEQAATAILVQQDGAVILANPAALALLGAATPGDLVGRPLSDILGQAGNGAGVVNGAATAEPPAVKQEVARLDGTSRFVEAISVPFVFEGRPAFQVALLERLEQTQVEEEVSHREAILQAVGFAAEQFLRSPDWRQNIAAVLERLGQSTNASRVYLFENHLLDNGRLGTTQRFEWCQPGIQPDIAAPELQNFDFEAAGFGRWQDLLGRGKSVLGDVRDFPDSERALLISHGIRSLVAMPVFAGADWWGHIGFDECLVERQWTAAEVDALKAAAETLGAAIRRREAERQIVQRGDEFSALFDTARDLSSLEDLPGVLRTIVQRSVALIGTTAGSMYLYDAERDRLEVTVSTDASIPLGTLLRLGEGLAGQVAATRQPMMVADYATWAGRTEKYDPLVFRAVLEVPMIYSGTLVGVLAVHEGRDVARQYTEADSRLLSLLASLAAGAVHSARLFAQTRRHLSELEAVNKLSTALRSAQDLDQMLPTLLDQTLVALKTGAGQIWLYDAGADVLRSVVSRGWLSITDAFEAKPGEGISGWVFASGEPYITREFASDSNMLEAARHKIPAGWGGVCLAFRTSADAIVGGMFVSVQLPRELDADDLHLLSIVAEIAGNAIQRTRLHAQTERRLRRLTALHAVETAIGASLDLSVTLSVVIEHVLSQLQVDAADILLFNQPAQILEFSAGRGFRTNLAQASRTRIGEGLAGRAALERHIIYANESRGRGTQPLQPAILAAEGFVGLCAVPLIAKGRVVGVLELFQRSPILPDPEWSEFLETLAKQAALAIDDAALFSNLQRSNLELTLAYDSTLEGWARALELRDAETEGHSRRVVELAERLGRGMSLSDYDLMQLHRGALLHDIGKVGIPDEILRKPGPLTPDEWQIMQRHPTYAFELLSPIKFLQPALDVPYCHHERWDGSGYPRGLKGDQIPLPARIFALVDVWDALLSDRPYRKAWTVERVRAYIRGQSGIEFDPRVVQAFEALIVLPGMNPSDPFDPQADDAA